MRDAPKVDRFLSPSAILIGLDANEALEVAVRLPLRDSASSGARHLIAALPIPQRPQLDPSRLLQDGARGEALDLGQKALDAAAAVCAGQVKAAQGGGRGVTPLTRRPVSGFATDRS